jgi:hypothetical protein
MDLVRRANGYHYVTRIDAGPYRCEAAVLVTKSLRSVEWETERFPWPGGVAVEKGITV